MNFDTSFRRSAPRSRIDGSPLKERIDRHRRQKRRDALAILVSGTISLGVGALVGYTMVNSPENDNLVGITPDTQPTEMPGYGCMVDERNAGNIPEGSAEMAIVAANRCIGALLNGPDPDPTEVAILADIFSN